MLFYLLDAALPEKLQLTGIFSTKKQQRIGLINDSLLFVLTIKR